MNTNIVLRIRFEYEYRIPFIIRIRTPNRIMKNAIRPGLMARLDMLGAKSAHPYSVQ